MKHIYIDECKGSNQSFYLLVHIYGEEIDALSFENDIRSINDANPTLLGNNFKCIHAQDVKDKNKATKGALAELWLDKLQEYICSERLKCFIAVQSAKKKKENSDFVSNNVKNLFDNPDANKIFPGLASVSDQERRDIAACVHQIWFLASRSDKIDAGSFIVHPDEIGKIVEDIEGDSQTYSNAFGKSYSFKQLIGCVLNTALYPVRKCFKQTNDLRIESFEPQKDESSFLIQMCDIIGNYFFHSMHAKMRESKPISQYKLSILETRFGLKQSLDDLSKNFCLNEKKELECSNDTYAMCIDINVIKKILQP